MRSWIPGVMIGLGYLLSALASRGLPAQVAPRWDALFPWASGGESVPRAGLVYGLPTVALAVWLLLLALASPAGERAGRRIFPAWLLSDRTGAAGVERFGPTFDVIVAAIVAVLLSLHAVLLGSVSGWPGWTMNGFAAAVGAALLVVGNIVPRTRPNWVAGLRTRATLADPDTWRRTHRHFGWMLMLTGVATILVSLGSAAYALVTAGVGALISALAATALGRRPPAAVLVLLLAGTAPAAAQAGPVERELEVVRAGFPLRATLALPADSSAPVPVAVIVAGSGPTDRNGNGPLVQTDLYRQLAHGLARRGIASIRYDKRGIGEASRTLDHAALTLDDFVDDVLAVARTVAADPRFSRVLLVGHSEGAGLVLQAANRGAPAAGIAMLSGTGRPLHEVLHDQFALQVDSATTALADSAFARFVRGEEVTDAPAIAAPVLFPGYRRLIASMAAYDPEGEIARATVPVLIVQGGMDLQVIDSDAARLRAAQPKAAFLHVATANHVFKATVTRDPEAQMTSYRDPALPVVPELVDGLADWVGSVP